MRPEDLQQEIRDNKSHFLVTLLDFCDQVKNQSRDNYYRSRIDTVVTDLRDLHDKLVNSQSNMAAEVENVVKDLLRLKQETQVEMQIGNEEKTLVDYHKALVEYIKKRVHCDVNNYDRRIRLILNLPFDKHRIEPLRDKE